MGVAPPDRPVPAPRATKGTRVACACPKRGLDILRRARKDDKLRHRAVPGQTVALVDAELLGLGDDMLGAERRLQLGDEGGGQAHTASLARHDARVGGAARRAVEVGFSHASDRAPREDRLRRPQLPRPRGGAGRRATEGAAPLREVDDVAHRAGRADRDPVDRHEGGLRGGARRRHRRARTGRVEGERLRSRARLPLRERRQCTGSPVLGRPVDAREVARTRSVRSGP